MSILGFLKNFAGVALDPKEANQCEDEWMDGYHTGAGTQYEPLPEEPTPASSPSDFPPVQWKNPPPEVEFDPRDFPRELEQRYEVEDSHDYNDDHSWSDSSSYDSGDYGGSSSDD